MIFSNEISFFLFLLFFNLFFKSYFGIFSNDFLSFVERERVKWDWEGNQPIVRWRFTGFSFFKFTFIYIYFNGGPEGSKRKKKCFKRKEKAFQAQKKSFKRKKNVNHLNFSAIVKTLTYAYKKHRGKDVNKSRKRKESFLFLWHN